MIRFSRSSWKLDQPWDESITSTSTPASISFCARTSSPLRVMMEAPTSSCLFASMDAVGHSRVFFRSWRVVNATSS